MLQVSIVNLLMVRCKLKAQGTLAEEGSQRLEAKDDGTTDS